MNILITGCAQGIGLAVAKKFLNEGHEVYGLDISSSEYSHPNFHLYQADIREESSYPELPPMDAVFHNAGIQNKDDIQTNLIGTIHVNEKFGMAPGVKAILFNASASARSGKEFPEYAASKAGVVGYMKNVATRLAPKGVTVNAISLGGVITKSNESVMSDPVLWSRIMNVTPMKKWMSEEEVAEWVYFLLTVNRSMSGQDILIDNGENDLSDNFVWPEK